MRIDDTNKRILLALDTNSRQTERQLAKLIGKSKHAVHYRLQQMEKAGVIQQYSTWIDPTKLGYQSAKLYLTLANIPERKRAFIEYVMQDRRLFWLGIAEGAWNAGITYFVRTNQEFYDIKSDLLSRFADIILESSTANLVAVHYFGATYLSNEESPETILFSEPDTVEMDDVDVHVLSALYNNSRSNLAKLAVELGVSASTVANRIKKMEQNGIIARYTCAVDFQKFGYDFYKAFLFFKQLTNEDLKAIIQYCKQEKSIRDIVQQISSWDLEVELICASYQEYNEVMGRLTERFSHIIRRVETAIFSEDYIFQGDKPIFAERTK